MKKFMVICVALLASPMAAAKDFRFTYTDGELLAPHELYVRLEQQVAHHCREINDIRNLRDIQICNENLLEITIEEIGNPRLTAFHVAGPVMNKS